MGRAANSTASAKTGNGCRTGWHREQIKAAIRMRGVTLEQFSEGQGFHRNAAKHALERKYRKVEVAISAFIDVPLWELWPDRWRTNGTRIDERYHSQRARAKA
jgi:Ner family transcriptional regulator